MLIGLFVNCMAATTDAALTREQTYSLFEKANQAFRKANSTTDDPDLAESVLFAEMQAESIYAIAVKENDGRLFVGKQRDEGWEITGMKDETFTERGLIAKPQDLLHEGEQLGSVELYLTPKFMQKELKKVVWNILVTVFVLDLFVAPNLTW